MWKCSAASRKTLNAFPLHVPVGSVTFTPSITLCPSGGAVVDNPIGVGMPSTSVNQIHTADRLGGRYSPSLSENPDV